MAWPTIMAWYYYFFALLALCILLRVFYYNFHQLNCFFYIY
ncbi:Hypothetical protein ETEE_2804 [Edwardsiella anguillarum ET080813]|uniref:Uncharacterized protein n=1 Tax=Edwardsiella anguillarum ET080813 TaxID=667120 RepID=A0A076LRC6_9GAMM|nr:Hypothetical protein ETEE_2804 [Edwardsiella anguillarum ET080813]